MTIVPGRNRTGHGGNIHAFQGRSGQHGRKIIDFSANINPLGPPEWIRSLFSRELGSLLHYPDPEYRSFVQQVSSVFDVNPSCIVAANGSTELLYALPRVLSFSRAVIVVPSYIDYAKAVTQAGKPVKYFYLAEQDNFKLDCERLDGQIGDGDLVVIGTPNNPTGDLVPGAALRALAKNNPGAIFLIDEAFLDFTEHHDSVGGASSNILTLNSMTKFFGVPGLRLGFGIYPSSVADLLKEHLPPWTVNSLAEKFGEHCLRDVTYQALTRSKVRELKDQLVGNLMQIAGLKIYPSNANFLLIRITSGATAPELAEKLLDKGFLIRCCDNYEGLTDTYFRIAVRTEEENSLLLNELSRFFAAPASKVKNTPRKRTPALMFQGTSSNAGKSILTAALCRILLQDGVNVAPFKAQNMSLNSFVTRNGEEMGRAQVVQAQAARLDPDVRMNPILLKPNSDTGSQIIVKGKPVGNMSVLDYGKYKPHAWEAVRHCYDSLADEYDVIVLEGAGSPGEVNLKAEDIVNMKMARYAESPVLLVGDIDRGGVYASFVGTMEVLSDWERELIGGFIVNRFRGQQSLLDSAHNYLLQHTGKEALGVIPYLHNLGLPEEDSVSFKSGLFNSDAVDSEYVDIVLVNFPHISNFTDVEPLLAEPDVKLRVVESPSELGEPDVIILPGSKNVIGDLRFLEARGFPAIMHKMAENGCEIVGICGGYQVLGRQIKDPLGIESSSTEVSGIGLLNIETELEAEKHLTRQRGVHLQSGHEVIGYEIHHGVSSSADSPVLKFSDGRTCGTSVVHMKVWGTYLHGIFDSDQFRRWFIDNIRMRKGFVPKNRVVAAYDLEPAFDRLAAAVRESLDMKKIYSLLGI